MKINVYKEIDVGTKILLLLVEDPIFIYPTIKYYLTFLFRLINSGAIPIQKEIVKESQWRIWLIYH